MSKNINTYIYNGFYDLIDKYAVGISEYQYDVVEKCVDYMNNCKEVKNWMFDCGDYPDVTGGIVSFAWVTVDNQLGQILFDYVY
jgi:hypothetical protein